MIVLYLDRVPGAMVQRKGMLRMSLALGREERFKGRVRRVPIASKERWQLSIPVTERSIFAYLRSLYRTNKLYFNPM